MTRKWIYTSILPSFNFWTHTLKEKAWERAQKDTSRRQPKQGSSVISRCPLPLHTTMSTIFLFFLSFLSSSSAFLLSLSILIPSILLKPKFDEASPDQAMHVPNLPIAAKPTPILASQHPICPTSDTVSSNPSLYQIRYIYIYFIYLFRYWYIYINIFIVIYIFICI